MKKVKITGIGDRDSYAKHFKEIIGQIGLFVRDKSIPAVGQYVSGEFTPDNPILGSSEPISFYRVSVKDIE